MQFNLPEDNGFLADLEDGVLRLTFNRPEHGNAIPTHLTPYLAELFETAQGSGTVRAVLVSGKGRNLSAGGDIQGFARSLEGSAEERQEEFRMRIGRLGRLARAVAAFDRPVVVALRGAVAGAALVYLLSADYVVADESGLVAFAHIGIGLSPDGGVSALLPRVVGERMARSLVLTGARLKAEEALRLGLVNEIVPGEELEARAQTLALSFAARPQRALRHAKRLIVSASTRSFAEQLDAELEAMVDCVADEDFREGVTAFLEKRKPRFPSAG